MKKALRDFPVKKGVPYLLFKIAAFLVLACIVDYLIGGIFNHFYFKQSSGWEYRTKYSVEETKADILIFGASRAQQQYNPVYFEEGLNKTCYNVGRDGEPIFYYYGVLQGVLKRYAPEMIILDIENGVFKKSQDSYDRLSVLLPFYKDHPEMRKTIELRGPFEKFKLQSQVYPYNSLLFKIAMGNVPGSKKKNEDIKGYLPLNRSLDEPTRPVDLSATYEIDTVKLSCYKDFIKECIQANVTLYIVCSPYYINATGTDTSMTLAKNIAAEYKIGFIDFARDEYFLKSPGLFDDTVHVNREGAKIFSNRLVDSILARSKVVPGR